MTARRTFSAFPLIDQGNRVSINCQSCGLRVAVHLVQLASAHSCKICLLKGSLLRTFTLFVVRSMFGDQEVFGSLHFQVTIYNLWMPTEFVGSAFPSLAPRNKTVSHVGTITVGLIPGGVAIPVGWLTWRSHFPAQ